MGRTSLQEILAETEREGVDLSMLRERLLWTPTKRLEYHRAALVMAEALRHAKRTSQRTRRPAPIDDSVPS